MHSKHFRGVWKQRNTEERDFRCFVCAENGLLTPFFVLQFFAPEPYRNACYAGYLSFFFVRFLASRKVSSQEQENRFTGISSIDICAMKSVAMCLFCGKLLRYKSIILNVDSNHGTKNTCRSDSVSLTFLAMMQCSLIFFAVLWCSEPLMSPSYQLKGLDMTIS